MRKLILIRHGNYDSNRHLNPEGRQQIFEVIKKLKIFIRDKSLIVLTSTADRAIESAQIITSFFDCELLTFDLLHIEDDNCSGLDVQEIINLIHLYDQEKEIIILVTHHPCLREFCQHFSTLELNTSLTTKTPGFGEVMIIDCVKKEARTI